MTCKQQPRSQQTPSPYLEAIEPVEVQILTAVKGIRYGSVEVVVQDGKVVQIERKEKVRLA